MYRSIETSIWYDPKFEILDPCGKLFFLYLITNSYAHLSGIYRLPLITISHETNISLKQIKSILNTLSHTPCDTPSDTPCYGGSDVGLAFYDHKLQIVFVKNMLKHQGRGEKIKKNIENHLKNLHKCKLINDFLNYYSHWNFKIDTPYHTPSDTPCYGGSIQEQEQEKEQEQKRERGAAAEKKFSLSENFEFEEIEKAMAKNYGVDLDAVFYKFRNHQISKDKKTFLRSAWKNWLVNEIEYSKKNRR